MRLLRRAIVVYREGGLELFLSYSWRYLKGNILQDRLLYPLVSGIRRLLSVFIPTDPGLVLFGFTSTVKGNSGHVYERLVEQNENDLTPTWMTSNKSLYGRLSANGYPVAYRYSLRGQLLLLRAEVACYDGLYRHTLPDRLTKIKIRHEVPIKDGPEAAKDAVTPTDVPNHDYIVTSSEFLAEKQFEYHRARKGGARVRREQFVNLGFPRNDVLFDIPDELQKRWDTFVGDQQYDQIILYAPTRRRHEEYETENTDLFPFDDFDVSGLNSLLEDLNALLLIRLHPSDSRRVSDTDHTYKTRHNHETVADLVDELCSNERVRLASSDTFADTNEILQFTDVLITDYSTVYHTFLLFDRPILFFPYDYVAFENSFGFKYDYYEHLPGPAIDSFTDFNDYLVDLSSGKDAHRESRAQLQRNIHDHLNGRATDRTVEFIKKHCSIS